MLSRDAGHRAIGRTATIDTVAGRAFSNSSRPREASGWLAITWLNSRRDADSALVGADMTSSGTHNSTAQRSL